MSLLRSLLKCSLAPPTGFSSVPARKWAALAYNLLQASGWLYCAFCLDRAVGFGVFDVEVLAAKTFPGVGHAVVTMQTLAMIEPVLCLVGVIPSSFITVLLQVIVRNVVILVAVNRHEALQLHVSAFLFLFAWIVTEIVRFPWLVFKSLGGKPPALLTLMRYGSPLVLYPLGGVGEGWAMYRALDAKVGGSDVLFSSSAGGFNLSLTLSQLVTFVYFPAFVPGFLYLYANAFGQCRKQTRKVFQELGKEK